MPTRKQSKIATRIALSQIEYYDDEIEQQQIPIQSILKKDHSQQQYKQALFQHYTHEHRLESLKHDIQQTYDTAFKNTVLHQVNLIIGCRNNPKLKDEIIKRKRPSDAIRRPKKSII